jgi:microcystin-dependent protein
LSSTLKVTGSFNYLPRGSIIAYNQTSAPKGWAICNGSQGTPDLRGRFILGNGGSRGMNTTGGAETVTLTVNQMPSHNHNVNGKTSLDGNHNHVFKVGRGGSNGNHGTSDGYKSDAGWDTHTFSNGNHTHTFNVNSGYAGGNQAHENMPPFYVLTYIMKL